MMLRCVTVMGNHLKSQCFEKVIKPAYQHGEKGNGNQLIKMGFRQNASLQHW